MPFLEARSTVYHSMQNMLQYIGADAKRRRNQKNKKTVRNEFHEEPGEDEQGTSLEPSAPSNSAFAQILTDTISKVQTCLMHELPRCRSRFTPGASMETLPIT